jgi:chromate transporter
MEPPDPQSASPQNHAAAAPVSLAGLTGAFLKIGSIGFGGGMAVIALMEQEFVRKRRLIPLDEFVHSVGLGQVLGSFAVNVATFIGYRRFGIAGAMLATAAFLAPSVALVILLSAFYFHFHALPALQNAVAGLSPVVIALILSAAWSIGRKVIGSWTSALIALGAFAAGLTHLNTLWVLAVAGAAGFFLPVAGPAAKPPQGSAKTAGITPGGLLMLAMPAAAPIPTIVTTFFKVGLVFFGGGFVLVPVLHHYLVTQLGWLKPQEFLDGVAISNLTPGPIAVLATFAGFHQAGVAGALAATAALFAPGILLMLAISHEYARFRNDQRAQRFLAGVNPAVAGLILSAAFLLGRSALASWHGYALLALSGALLIRLRWHPAFVLAIGAASGSFGWLP